MSYVQFMLSFFKNLVKRIENSIMLALFAGASVYDRDMSNESGRQPGLIRV